MEHPVQPTTVVNVKTAYCDVYVGRVLPAFMLTKCPPFPLAWKQTAYLWGNPFTVSAVGRRVAIELYERLMLARLTGALQRDDPDPVRLHFLKSAGRIGRPDTPEGWRSSLDDLYGKRLGCWCAPEPCHADVLVRLLAGKLGPIVAATPAPLQGVHAAV